MRQYEMTEFVFQAPRPAGSLAEVPLRAVFSKDGRRLAVNGFYAGGGSYKVRFCPDTEGEWQYEVKGLVNEKGSFFCEPANGGHGLVRARGTHFVYDDGGRYIPFGTTVYALWYQEEKLVRQTMKTLGEAPFNKIRVCVFPKHFDYNHNEPELFPFERDENGTWDVHKPCVEFWNQMETIIAKWNEMEIQCDLILFHPYDRWGFSELSLERAEVYLDYAMRRLAAYPNIWWSLANEYDLMAYTKEDWLSLAKMIRERDPYGHLLSIHNMLAKWDFSDTYTTHVCLQLKNVDEISKIIKKYNKPVVVDECCYEGNLPFEWGNLSAFELVNRFWKIYLQGGYASHGETFESEDDILWWSKGGTLKGESPKRIAFLKKIMEELPGDLCYTGMDMTGEAAAMMAENPPKEWAESSFRHLARHVTASDIEEMLLSARMFTAAFGEEAFITYYDRHCTCRAEMNLPKEKKYTLEVIDVWNMTRKRVMEHVNGHVVIPLPGKEGMAVLAVSM